MKKIVLISCTKKKLPHGARAELFYSPSARFRNSLAYARSLHPDAIYVLSAEHWLVSLDQHLEPYEKTLKKVSRAERSEWARQVLRQLALVCSPANDHFIILAGKDYYESLIPGLPDHCLPLMGLGQGKGLQFLKRHIPSR
ncbi:MAG TPA: hypothetical protein VI136_11055 [Verrucomicrobiae bacterium]